MTPSRIFTARRKNYGKVNSLIPFFAIVALLAGYYAVYHSGLFSGVVEREEESGQIEIVETSCSQDEYENWVVTLSVRSLDEVDFHLSKILVKNMEVSSYHSDPPASKVSTLTTEIEYEMVLPSGEEAEIVIWIGREFGMLQPTQRVSIRIHDSAGVVYTASVVLAGSL